MFFLGNKYIYSFKLNSLVEKCIDICFICFAEFLRLRKNGLAEVEMSYSR